MTTSTRKYETGALKATRSKQFKDFEVYQTTLFPTPPPTWEVPGQKQITQGIEVYPMDNNEKEGDCTIAGLDHLNRAGSILFKEPYAAPTDTQIKTKYRSLTGGGDTGLNEEFVLKTWYEEEIFGTKIAGFAPLSTTSLLQWHQAIAFTGAVYLGIACPNTAQEQFAKGEPWTFQGEQTEDGHCIVALGYGPNGGLHCATWGGIAVVTPSFLAHYLTEAWVVIPQQLVEAKKDTLGINVELLQADLSKL